MTPTAVAEVLDDNLETGIAGLFRVGCVKDGLEVAPSLRGGQEAWCRDLKDPEVAAAGALFGLRLINGVDGVRNVEVMASVVFGQICAWFHPIFMVLDLRGGGRVG
jgi:hypothetical protein